MTTTTLSPTPVQKFFDNNGNALANGQLYTYAGGTSTPIATYTDNTGSTSNTNPIILNSRGECNLWLTPNVSYKFVLQDSLGNTIWTVDQVVNNALISLFGGTDTGTAGAYVLNFTSNFTSLSNGIIIYFIAANTNNGNSTINVNGLGVVNIQTVNGMTLSAGMIVGGALNGIIYFNGNWLLIESPFMLPQPGSFNLTVAGFSAPSPVPCEYTVIGDTCMIRVQPFAYTSNATTFTGTVNLAAIQPASKQYVMIPAAQDAGASVYAQVATVAPGSGTTVNFTFYKNGSSSGWTASGAKGLSDSSGNFYITFTYKLSS
jgi:hypothetical protein